MSSAVTNPVRRSKDRSGYQPSPQAFAVNQTFPVGAMTGWQRTAMHRIIELRSLPENWDSYGSPPVSMWVAQMAIDVLLEIPFEDFPVPAVVPAGDGVQLAWSIGPRELEVFVGPHQAVEIVKIEHGEPIEEGGFAVARDYFAWLGER